MSQHSVLILEDRQEICRRLQSAIAATEGLELAGVAGTLDQGVPMIFARQPRVVLVDIGLPDGSGIEAITALQRAHWPVDALVISIFGDETRVVEAIRAGAKGYILKGGNLAEVGTAITSLIEGGSPISPAIARHVLNIAKTGLPGPGAPAELLTERETEILRAVSRGYKRREIAEQLGISAGTVGNHITSIYRKLEVRSNMEAVAQASQAGMI
ncbi:response regulator transcription factor [Pseudooceanicola sp. CBS1P-1]|uniref:Response regulator n=1 Tax=Pseudooceanicola albus TaxID=2692189 RepID=A0A6L7G7E9_9RHOB|nr:MULTISPECIES: response regulator transcription factor [Pseudooceanicola]MBT9385987.1 response regulator transcription factor [Pseudooceanicola endophyticus]MXN19592.1 response regulator [Pseudooceanicola albus]